MHKHVTDISRFVDRLPCPHEQKQKIFEYAIAQALALRLPIPTSEVANFARYYADTHHAYVSTEISRINEIKVVDVRFMIDLVSKLYKHRYKLVYAPLDAFSFCTFLASAVKSDALPPAVHETAATILANEEALKGFTIAVQSAFNVRESE